MPTARDEDTPARKLGHVEDDPPVPDGLAGGEADQAWLAAERRAEPARQGLERERRG